MARLTAVLKAVATAFRRDWKSFGSLGANNLLPVSVYLLREAGGFVYLIAGVVTLLPMSGDPLRKIPPSRLSLWPLTRRERWLLRALSPWINPIFWLVMALAVWALHGRITLGLWALAAGLFAAGFALPALPIRAASSGVSWAWRRMPHFPGPLDQLIRKNLREILTTLDFYCALLLSLSLLFYRLFGPALPPEAMLAMTLLIVLALSTYTQSMFGLDGQGGLSRYRLLPLAGWQILAAKDGAFVAACILLTLPAAPSGPLAGLGAGLFLLATGHGPTVDQRRQQMRWRFTTSASIGYGILQSVLMGVAGAGVFFHPWLLPPAMAVWAASLWWYGKRVHL